MSEPQYCRSLRGNVDRNSEEELKQLRSDGRSLRGNVDRNQFSISGSTENHCVVPYVGTWIEIMVLMMQL